MENILLMQLLTLSLFTFFMGFCFCDGFKLHILRKLIWFLAFLYLCIVTLKTKGNFDLVDILPVSLILAILLCAWQKIKAGKRKQ